MTLEEKMRENATRYNKASKQYFIDIKSALSICQEAVDEANKRDSIILTTNQICQIAEFAGLDINYLPSLDEFEIEYTIDKSDKGLFIWTTEYPEEGSVNLSLPEAPKGSE